MVEPSDHAGIHREFDRFLQAECRSPSEIGGLVIYGRGQHIPVGRRLTDEVLLMKEVAMVEASGEDNH